MAPHESAPPVDETIGAYMPAGTSQEQFSLSITVTYSDSSRPNPANLRRRGLTTRVRARTPSGQIGCHLKDPEWADYKSPEDSFSSSQACKMSTCLASHSAGTALLPHSAMRPAYSPMSQICRIGTNRCTASKSIGVIERMER